MDKETIRCYREFIELYPNFAFLNNDMGRTNHEKGNYDRAIECYKNAIKIKPDFPAAYNNMGRTYHAKGNYNEAIECYKKAIELLPDAGWNYRCYYNMGRVYHAKGNYDEAIECYKKAIELMPDFTEAYDNCIKVYKMIGNDEGARMMKEKKEIAEKEIENNNSEPENNLPF